MYNNKIKDMLIIVLYCTLLYFTVLVLYFTYRVCSVYW